MHLESESTENQQFAQWLLEIGNEARILTGDYAGNLTFIPRILLTSSASELPFIFRWRQFPIQLAFAMTINRSQGQSVKHVGLDLRTPVFSHSQLYVALSCCTSLRNIKILLPPNSNHTLNIVYPE
ncbi:6030_t:CDS:2, partial [Gigaspora margarita]